VSLKGSELELASRLRRRPGSAFAEGIGPPSRDSRSTARGARPGTGTGVHLRHDDPDPEAGIRAGPDRPGCLRGPVFRSGGRPGRPGPRLKDPPGTRAVSSLGARYTESIGCLPTHPAFARKGGPPSRGRPFGLYFRWAVGVILSARRRPFCSVYSTSRGVSIARPGHTSPLVCSMSATVSRHQHARAAAALCFLNIAKWPCLSCAR
jgi:hypothetical protein